MWCSLFHGMRFHARTGIQERVATLELSKPNCRSAPRPRNLDRIANGARDRVLLGHHADTRRFPRDGLLPADIAAAARLTAESAPRQLEDPNRRAAQRAEFYCGPSADLVLGIAQNSRRTSPVAGSTVATSCPQVKARS
jgi:hypothetical protein